MIRKPPFATARDEADAIDARILFWRVRSGLGDHHKLRVINYRLAVLITDGMKYAARLRAKESSGHLNRDVVF